MLYEIKQFCRAKEISYNRFGMLAIGDGRLVSNLDRGRKLGEDTAARVHAFLTDNADATFDYATLTPAGSMPRQFYNANLTPYLGKDDWQVNIASGTVSLYNAIAKAHPERITA